MSSLRKLHVDTSLITAMRPQDRGIQVVIMRPLIALSPVTVAARSKAWTIFARSESGIVGLNPTQNMDVCYVCVFIQFVLSYV
jgi:hypothetical protein